MASWVTDDKSRLILWPDTENLAGSLGRLKKVIEGRYGDHVTVEITPLSEVTNPFRRKVWGDKVLVVLVPAQETTEDSLNFITDVRNYIHHLCSH
ncbi:MAG TPA: hypothetical protein VJG85_01100 [Patescibacteria group bacterium]|nr:hypothetical protein [Patescibacteria group bacterium]